MLENLRDKIYTVQQDLSNRVWNASSKKGGGISLNAGADILQEYQTRWEELHNNCEENAKKAEAVDGVVQNMQCSCRQHLDSFRQLNVQLGQLPKLQASIAALMGKIGELQGLFEEIENSLLRLEDVIETQELQEKQLDRRFQLALYKEKKIAQFEELKVQLSREHAKNVQTFERRQQAVFKERQEAFREAFEEEMRLYKTQGHIERISTAGGYTKQAVELSDIDLDADEEGQSALDAFLDEETAANLAAVPEGNKETTETSTLASEAD